MSSLPLKGKTDHELAGHNRAACTLCPHRFHVVGDVPMRATHRALIVPVDVTKPCILIDLPDDDPRALHDAVGTDMLEFAAWPQHRIVLVVDEIGMWKNLPPNTRAMNYLRTVTHVQHDYPIVGDALFMGTTPQGEDAHVPDSLLRAAGVK